VTAVPDWTGESVESVAAGVWRIPLSLGHDGLKAVNVYALQDGCGVTLIDAGWAITGAREELAEALSRIGARLSDVSRVLVTHFHRDHYTEALALRREFGVRVHLGSGERQSIDLVTRPAHPALGSQFDLLARHGAQPVLAALRAAGIRADVLDKGYEAPDSWIESGATFAVGTRMLRAIATPGHTRGHTVFVDQEGGLLFAGDHVLPHITPSVGFEPQVSGEALGQYLDSLAIIRSLPDLALLPAHGAAGGSVHQRVDALLAHHSTRLDAVARLVVPAGTTAYRVATGLPWTSRLRRLEDLDAFNQLLAVCETVLHLNVLVARGRALAGGFGAECEYMSVSGAWTTD
jgi:glyoxylase-like metal-dependent hydrolase (beta-lactamase superfamily II)